MTASFPAFAHLVTVLGDTRKITATSDGVSSCVVSGVSLMFSFPLLDRVGPRGPTCGFLGASACSVRLPRRVSRGVVHARRRGAGAVVRHSPRSPGRQGVAEHAPSPAVPLSE